MKKELYLISWRWGSERKGDCCSKCSVKELGMRWEGRQVVSEERRGSSEDLQLASLLL